MEDTGYIKLYRKLLESPIFENEKALKIWIWCLCKATHKERIQLVGHQKIQLEKGQFIFGRKKASEELKMSESMIYRYIQLLKELQMLNIKSNNKFSVVSIEKWEEYQIENLKITSNQTTNEQQMNTNKNVKNIYLYLFNIYKEKLKSEPKKFVQIISDMKRCNEYNLLTDEEQEKIFYDLMGVNKRFK